MKTRLIRRPADKVIDGVERLVPDGQDYPVPAALAVLLQLKRIEGVGYKDWECPQTRQLAESVPLIGVEEMGRGQVLPAEFVPEADLPIEQKVQQEESTAQTTEELPWYKKIFSKD